MRNHVGCPAAFLASSLLLTACSGGGTAPAPVTPVAGPVGGGTIPKSITVGQPATASLRGNSLPLASGATPNFTTSLPAIGTALPLNDTVMHSGVPGDLTGTPITDATTTLSGGTTLIFEGTETVGGTTRNIYKFQEPGLSVDDFVSNAPSLPDGRVLSLSTTTLNYTLLGFWSLRADKTNDYYFGAGFSGFQTPPSALPSSGTAAYVAGGAGSQTGSVSGLLMFNGNPGQLNGQANISVNFAAATVNGSLTNMTASFPGSAAAPWNNVGLSGTLSGAAMQGATSIASQPPPVTDDYGTIAFSNAAKGTFTGALFGPHGEELGMSWNIYETGKAAFGTVAATKQ